MSSSLVWELDEEEFSDILALASEKRQYTRNGSLPQAIMDSLVDPDEIAAKIKPRLVKKQQQELKTLQPLRVLVTSHLEPHLQYARYLVWSVLNSGAVNTRQARKLAATIYGWETLFLKVFGAFGETGPVTVRRNAPENPPTQPESYEGAWASGKRREIQVLCGSGKVLDAWCSFKDFLPTQDRYFIGSGYKEVSAKFVMEVAAIHTVNTTKAVGRQSKVAIYVSTAFVNSSRQIIWSPIRWKAAEPICNNAAARSHLLSNFDIMQLVQHTPGRDSSVQSLTTQSPTHSVLVLSSASETPRSSHRAVTSPSQGLSSPPPAEEDD